MRLADKKAFSTFEVAQIMNIKYGRLREWLIREDIHPSIQISKGQGSKTLFSLKDIYMTQLFLYFTELGFKRNVARFMLFSDFMPKANDLKWDEYLVCDQTWCTSEDNEALQTGILTPESLFIYSREELQKKFAVPSGTILTFIVSLHEIKRYIDYRISMIDGTYVGSFVEP